MTSEMALDRKYIRSLGENQAEIEVIVPSMHCAGCMGKIEKGFVGLDGIEGARANLSTKRVAIRFNSARVTMREILDHFISLGFEASPFDASVFGTTQDKESKKLLKSLAVAGFASMNIMLLSVSVWSGSDMVQETRTFFHWLSAIISLLAIGYSGQIFFNSALNALKVKTVNMDVPISLAIILATLASVYEAYIGGENVYFDAGVMLLFFLLTGRYLDHQMRAKASSVAQNMLALQAVPATVIMADGARHIMPAEEVQPNSTVFVAMGMRIPVDGELIEGESEIDTSLITGESLPRQAKAGSKVFAGTLNLSAPIKIRTTVPTDKSLLSEIVRLLEAAEQGRSKYVRIADRLARAYVPVVHLLAAGTFLGWYLYSGDWHMALMRSVAVLIITCPCALGLAVPAVQVVASGRLLSKGILVKSADALERLADIDTVVFDKTGTLTLGALELTNKNEINENALVLAASVARSSHHPLSLALVRAAKGINKPQEEITDVTEIPGEGIKAKWNSKTIWLGRQSFVETTSNKGSDSPELFFRVENEEMITFKFSDQPRSDARQIVRELKAKGLDTYLLSGDREAVATKLGQELELDYIYADQRPDHKIEFINQLKSEGKKVLMVGDGLNDAPALKAAHVSISPSSAMDIAQTASDFIFQGRKLGPIAELINVASLTKKLVFQNFSLALIYNVIAVPLAIVGFVTPLVAALAMSFSSLVVTVNSLRLKYIKSKIETVEKKVKRK